jgi:hypothetical protein
VETDLSGYADRNTDLKGLPPVFVDTALRHLCQLGSGLFCFIKLFSLDLFPFKSGCA